MNPFKKSSAKSQTIDTNAVKSAPTVEETNDAGLRVRTKVQAGMNPFPRCMMP